MEKTASSGAHRRKGGKVATGGIAYHGDTINTAARIQGMCNDLEQELLISEYLKDQLNNDNFAFDLLGSHLLRGKKEGGRSIR